MRTNDLLATGGMLQEGGTTDPVSGNDVPAGSLKEEVRDDIPAQLSPGEFVFPADVTRYIGLDKLMQIREAAKEGLKEMESKGQMGNAEEVADDVVDEDKFSTNIDEIIAGLDGGDDSEPQEFAEGGVVKTDSSYKDAPIKGFKMVQYEDPETKAVKYIPFVNGKPLLPIPKGYVEKKVVSPITPPTTTPVVEQPTTPVVGGGGGGGGRPTEGEGGGGVVDGKVKDTGVEGFGDIEGGTSRNVARAIGAGLSFFNPIVGAGVSLLGQYAIKVSNEKKAEDNAKAIDASSLREMGFEAKDIKAAQEAAAKATIEGKNAKEIAVAAANAASLSAGTALGKSVDGNYGAKTSLDALVGITNGWNTANKDVMSLKMTPELEGKVPPGMLAEVAKSVKEGLTPEQAVNLALDKQFKAVDTVVGPYFSGTTTMTEKEADARLKAAQDSLEAQALGVPAGEYDSVIGDIQFGYTPKEAILRAEERAFGPTESEISAKDTQMRQEAKENADKAEAERSAEVSRQEADRREAADEARNQSNLDAARDAADRAEAANRAERDIGSLNDGANVVGGNDPQANDGVNDRDTGPSSDSQGQTDSDRGD